MNDKELQNIVDQELLKASDLGQIPDNVTGGYLPKDVSAKIIEEITEKNFMRSLVEVVPVTHKTLQVPRILYGSTLNVYNVAHGVDVTSGNSEQTFATKSIALTPELLVAFVYVLETDLATAGLDLATWLRTNLTKALARAEQQAMLVGLDGVGGGYVDIFDGLYTIANDATKCAVTPVTYTPSDDLVDKVADAIKALGDYGDDRGQLVLLCANTFANRLAKAAKITQVGNYSLGGEVGITRTGTFPPIHGVDIITTPVLEPKQSGEVAILARKDGGLLGQRGQIIFRKKLIEEKFSQLLIMAEEIDFKWAHLDSSDKAVGMGLIKQGS